MRHQIPGIAGCLVCETCQATVSNAEEAALEQNLTPCACASIVWERF